MNDSPQNDTALMLKAKGGDTRAFTELHQRYQKRVLAFFFGLSGNPGVANDLCQETFLRVWTIRKRYRATGPFPAYLFAIARLIWREHQRTEQKQWRLGQPAPLEAGHDAPAPAAAGPLARATRGELGDRLLAALAQLPEEQRMVFLLRHMRGLSLEEIAGALDCPVNTVRSRKILAIKKLRHLLAPVWQDSPRQPVKD